MNAVRLEPPGSFKGDPVPVEKLTREGEAFRIGSKNVRSKTHTDDDTGCGADDVIDA
jgi:hypothetical protein